MSPISASSSDSENTVTISANVYEALGIPQFKAMHRKSALMAHIATAMPTPKPEIAALTISEY